MSAAAIALLIQLAPGLLQAGGAIAGNIHQDVVGYQQILLAQQITQQEYYKTLRVYYLTHSQRRCVCKTKAKKNDRR